MNELWFAIVLRHDFQQWMQRMQERHGLKPGDNHLTRSLWFDKCFAQGRAA